MSNPSLRDRDRGATMGTKGRQGSTCSESASPRWEALPPGYLAGLSAQSGCATLHLAQVGGIS